MIKYKLMKRADIYIIGSAVVLAALLLLFMGIFRQGEGSGVAIVYVGDAEYARLPLDESQTLTITQENGNKNVVIVFSGTVKMQSANCNNQNCVKQGGVALHPEAALDLGNWIICLPNGVSVEVRAGEGR